MNAITDLQSIQEMLDEDKATILFVAGGLKPTGFAVMQGAPYAIDETPITIDTAVIEKLDSILKELKLAYVTTTEIMDAWPKDGQQRKQEVMRIFCAPQQKDAERLKVLFDHVGDNHLEIGRLLGYPKTAVEAFLTGSMLPVDAVPAFTDEVNEADMRLLGHRVSKEHWQKEVLYLTKFGTYLRSVSPKLYESLTAPE